MHAYCMLNIKIKLQFMQLRIPNRSQFKRLNIDRLDNASYYQMKTFSCVSAGEVN
jgi:hypothetical protein